MSTITIGGLGMQNRLARVRAAVAERTSNPLNCWGDHFNNGVAFDAGRWGDHFNNGVALDAGRWGDHFNNGVAFGSN